MTLQRCFVQFMHPGPEHRPDRDGVKAWNADDHRRKFLVSPGTYLEAPSKLAQEDRIVFWGEWEPESEVQPVPERREADAPRWLHEPYYVRPASYRHEGKPLQNTDPFVFGERFLYTVCRQFTHRQRPTFLHDLDRGSVILFGSQRRGEFVLDTVFVVADSVLHTASNWRESLGARVNETYTHVTLGPVYEGSDFSGEPRLYFGATPDDPVKGMFSFVPCLPAEEGAQGFSRPTITLPGLITPAKNRGMKGKQERSLDELKRAWRSVVQQVTEPGLKLGVRLTLPPMRGIADHSKRQDQSPAGNSPRIRC